MNSKDAKITLHMKKTCKPTTNISDVVDFPPNSYIFRNKDMLFILAGMATYLTDLGFDCFTAYNHWNHNHFNWCYLTLGIIIIPSIFINVISLVWYFQDRKGWQPRPKRSVLHWFLRSIVLCLQLAPILRYAECLYYGWKSRQAFLKGDKQSQKKLYTFMLYEDADCVLLRLIESFLEAAPQLLLQLYILSLMPLQSATIWVYLLWLSCVTSLLSISWGVTAYFRDSRFTDPKKNNISIFGSLSILLWQFFSIGSRVVAVVMLASMINIWILVFCFCHYVFMFCWLLIRGSFMRIGSISYGVFLSGIFAAIYLFVYINDKDEPTRKKYAAFYIVCGIEHMGIMIAWLLLGDHSLWFYYPGLIVHYLTFVLGLLFMGGYYGLCHPTVRNPRDLSPDAYIPSPTSSSGSSVTNYKQCHSPVNLVRNPYLVTDIRRDSLRNLGNITPPLHLQNGGIASRVIESSSIEHHHNKSFQSAFQDTRLISPRNKETQVASTSRTRMESPISPQSNVAINNVPQFVQIVPPSLVLPKPNLNEEYCSSIPPCGEMTSFGKKISSKKGELSKIKNKRAKNS